MAAEEQGDLKAAEDLGAIFGFRLRHVGVVVPALGPAVETMRRLFGYDVVAGPFEDPIQKVAVSFLQQRSEDVAAIELVAPSTDDSPVRALLAKNVGGYHFCFETTDLEAALEHVRAQGAVVISGPVPAVAFEGRRIAWLYAPTRQLFELVETKSQSTP